MNKKEIKQVVYSSLRQIAPDTESIELTSDSYFGETLGLDSFDFLQLMVMLDERLNISIPEKDYGQITTLGLLVNYLVEKLQ